MDHRGSDTGREGEESHPSRKLSGSGHGALSVHARAATGTEMDTRVRAAGGGAPWSQGEGSAYLEEKAKSTHGGQHRIEGPQASVNLRGRSPEQHSCTNTNA